MENQINLNMKDVNEKDLEYMQKICEDLVNEKTSLEDECSLLTGMLLNKYSKNIVETLPGSSSIIHRASTRKLIGTKSNSRRNIMKKMMINVKNNDVVLNKNDDVVVNKNDDVVLNKNDDVVNKNDDVVLNKNDDVVVNKNDDVNKIDEI